MKDIYYYIYNIIIMIIIYIYKSRNVPPTVITWQPHQHYVTTNMTAQSTQYHVFFSLVYLIPTCNTTGSKEKLKYNSAV